MGKVVYVAGPYSAETMNGVWENIVLAQKAGMRLIDAGHIPVIPHSMWCGYEGEYEHGFFVDMGIGVMSKCDAICMVGDWPNSKGSYMELAAAVEMGKEVMFDITATATEEALVEIGGV